MTSQVKYNIIQGPDRLDILMSFAQYGVCEAGDLYFVAKNAFTVPKGVNAGEARDVRFYIQVTSVQHTNNSGTDWNIEGRLVHAQPLPLELRGDSPSHSRRVLIRYRTHQKKGTLEILGH